MCELCNAIKDAIWIEGSFFGLICKSCKIPMIVLKHHKENLSVGERNEMINIIKKRYPNYILRGYMRSIPDHWHDHLIEKVKS